MPVPVRFFPNGDRSANESETSEGVNNERGEIDETSAGEGTTNREDETNPGCWSDSAEH